MKNRPIQFAVRYAILVALGLNIFQVPSSAQADSFVSTPGCLQTVGDSSPSKVLASVVGDECVLTFYENNTWVPPSGGANVRYLVVGGGGGGAARYGGGGGAGGFLTGNVTLTNTQIISVGAGGRGGGVSGNGDSGESGSNSSFGSLTAIGGGGGQTSFGSDSLNHGKSGGSGGGAGIYSSSSTDDTSETGYAGGAPTSGQGYAGGGSGPGYSSLKQPNGRYALYAWSDVRNTGGGGGAGGPGITGKGGSTEAATRNTESTITRVKPDGGPGLSSDITGSSIFYAGGGGGASGAAYSFLYMFDQLVTTAGNGSGGMGGGGAGSPTVGTDGVSGTDYLGGGGGGGGVSETQINFSGGSGGKGVVIIRFSLTTLITPCGYEIDYSTGDFVTSTLLNGYCILTFTTGATRDSTTATNFLRLPPRVTSIEYLIVGGGGSGGAGVPQGNEGGAGGAGGLRTGTIAVNASDSLTVVIGVGGIGDSTTGTNGSDSYIRNGATELVRAHGGGKGSTTTANTCPKTTNPGNGGSGGGTSFNCGTTTNAGGTGNSGGYLPVEGYDGEGFTNPTFSLGGGGGGAGGRGGYRLSTQLRAHGGDGVISSITGSEKVYAGGGSGINTNVSGTDSTTSTAKFPEGGGAILSGSSRYVGVGGYAQACTGTNTTASTDGAADTGSGGGAGYCSSASAGGKGADGVIIIKYLIPTNGVQTNSLNMSCKSEGGGTQNYNFTTSPFSTETSTTITDASFPYAGDLSAKHDWGGDVTTARGGYGGPAGCGSNDWTVYISGYIQAPDDSNSKSVFFKTKTDDGAYLIVDGKVLINDKSDHGPSSYITARQNGTDYGLPMAPKSWHFVQFWMHERGGGAYAELAWWYSGIPGGSDQTIPITRLSKTVPRTITATYTEPHYSEVTALRATVDTASAVFGGVNDSSTSMSLGGSFQFLDSGTVINGCSSVRPVNGYAKCDWTPLGVETRTVWVVFIPDTSTTSALVQYKVFSTTILKMDVYVYKGHQAPIRIGQYDAFPGVSTYPLNVYSDSSTYPSIGAITRTLLDSGTANCVLDSTKFFLTAPKVGTCSVQAVRLGTTLYLPETVTATIYWIQFKNNFVTQVATAPTQIALSGEVQIIKHSYDTLTITNFQDANGLVITSAAVGDVIRIVGTGFSSTDMLTVIHLGGRNDLYLDPSIGGITAYSTSDPAANYFQFIIPDGTATDFVLLESSKGTVSSPTRLEIVTR